MSQFGFKAEVKESDYSVPCRTVEEVEEQAEKLGRVVVYPKPNQLFIDIDSDADLEIFHRLFELFRSTNKFKDSSFASVASPSGRAGRRHVTVTLPRTVEPVERVYLQSLLGSDPLREMLGFCRHDAGAEPEAISVFFESKDPTP